MSNKVSIVWFRQDLRLHDHSPLDAAVKRGGPVIPLYVWAPDEEAGWALGGASKWWLSQSLMRLDQDLRARGSRLILRLEPTWEALIEIIRDTKATAIFWNRRYEPASIERDEKIRKQLGALGITVKCFNDSLLFDPDGVRSKQNKPYSIFTPFWKACLSMPEPAPPFPAPEHIPAPDPWPASVNRQALRLEPIVNWVEEICAVWTPGVENAEARLTHFLRQGLPNYLHARNRPDVQGTSRLSPHIHFGEISLREIWHAVRRQVELDRQAGVSLSGDAYLRQLIWREFAYYLLYHFPHTTTEPLRPRFAHFPWEPNPEALVAWQRGYTGYPLIDAGMRELWTTGWMHNRIRMIVASFLVKDLLIPWQEGARWFWDTLVDADLANNTFGFQWVAGCGADASPFFRVFNPVLQGERFDPEGRYVQQWVPELAKMPAEWVHKPWLAPASVLSQAGVKLDKTYPHPIVDHLWASHRALRAYRAIMRDSGLHGEA